jgi:hypothetical protein
MVAAGGKDELLTSAASVHLIVGKLPVDACAARPSAAAGFQGLALGAEPTDIAAASAGHPLGPDVKQYLRRAHESERFGVFSNPWGESGVYAGSRLPLLEAERERLKNLW